jgi:hypothetical protein
VHTALYVIGFTGGQIAGALTTEHSVVFLHVLVSFRLMNRASPGAGQIWVARYGATHSRLALADVAVRLSGDFVETAQS